MPGTSVYMPQFWAPQPRPAGWAAMASRAPAIQMAWRVSDEVRHESEADADPNRGFEEASISPWQPSVMPIHAVLRRSHPQHRAHTLSSCDSPIKAVCQMSQEGGLDGVQEKKMKASGIDG